MIKKGTGAAQAEYFLHPDSLINIPHDQDITLRQNYEIHQKLTDEVHALLEPMDTTPPSSQPERVHAVSAVSWQGRLVDAAEGATITCIVGEDWIVQRVRPGELKIALYINPYHRFLPGSAPIDLR